MPRTVLVIGAGGAVGSALVDALLPDHHAGRLRLVAAAHRATSLARLRDKGVEVRPLDLDAAEPDGLEAVAPAFAGVDTVFLLTGYDVRMLAQSKAAVDAAVAAGATHLVHVGVSAEPDTTIVHFGWHQLIEAYVERSGLRHTHLRPAAYLQNLPLGITAPGVLAHFVGDARPNWVDVDDIAAVAAAVLRDPDAHAGTAYDLAAQPASLHEIVDELSAVTGRPWRYEPAEPDAFFTSMVAAGADPVYMACVRNVFERTRSGTLTDPVDAFGAIEAITGRPATSVRQFIEANRALFCNY